MPKTPTLLLPALSMDDADVPEWALDDSEEHDGIDQELLASAMILENEHGKIDSGIDEPLDNEDGLAQNNADWQTCQQGSYEQTGANNKFIDDNKNQQGNQNETPREQQRRQQQVDENRRLCSNALTAQLEIEEYLKEFAQNMINAVQTSIDCIRQVSMDNHNILEGLRQYKEALTTRGQELEAKWTSLRAHAASIASSGDARDNLGSIHIAR
ncbi:hypothetical protein VTP01DRAFT_6919 [Rhizomucor pusillus]|uniref:uncharacterized protein n=1 Tax=Rhizomucor pusillus TaxID=4840 RepID=UPI0037429979